MSSPRRIRILLLSSCLLAVTLYLLIAMVTTLPFFENPHGYYPERGDGLAIAVDFKPPTLELGSNGVMTLRDLWYTQSQSGDKGPPQRLCLDELVVINTENPPWLGVTYMEEGFPLCYDLEPIDAYNPDGIFVIATSFITEPLSVGLSSRRDSRWYPYDRFEFMLTYQMSYRLFYADGSSEAHEEDIPTVTVSLLETTEWDIDVRTESISNTVLALTSWVPEGELVVIGLRRPLLTRIMFVIIVAVIMLFILLLCFVDSRATFIEGAVGVFFGIFGLNQVLLPPATEVRTLVHFASWGLYVALAGVIVAHIYLALKETFRWYRTGETESQQEQKGTVEVPVQVQRTLDLSDEAIAHKPPLAVILGLAPFVLWVFIKWLGQRSFK